jgi:hypothetical protein
MEVRVQLLSGMSGLKKNSGNGNYPRAEIRATAIRAILSAGGSANAQRTVGAMRRIAECRNLVTESQRT